MSPQGSQVHKDLKKKQRRKGDSPSVSPLRTLFSSERILRKAGKWGPIHLAD
jgi:hypothetical protein